MLKKLPLRWRLTIITALLIAVCCIGLTLVLNFSAYRLANSIEATAITTPAQRADTLPPKEDAHLMLPVIPSEDVRQAKLDYRFESLLYMVVAVLLGSALTYYVAGRTLRPVKTLNEQVKNIHVNNLSETLDVPPAKDEIAQLTQSFNEMTDKLHEAFLMQQRFSMNAAHELRTPLTVLQTKIDVFHKKGQHTSEEYDALVASIQKQTGRLRELVSSLLNMTNMEDSEQQDILLSDLLEDIIDELSPLAKEKQVTLSLQCDSEHVYGSPSLLHRAFYNLVENAIKYNFAGGKADINTWIDSSGQVNVTVKDNGIGIPEDAKNHIFEPFYRVDKSRSREMGGAGLGLAMVETIIKKHGGTITVLENPDSGASFTINLPKTQ